MAIDLPSDGDTSWGDEVRAAITATQAVTVNLQTGTSYTLVLADGGKLVEMSNAAANTLTVPPNSSVAFPTGTVIEVEQVGAGQTTIVQGAGVTVQTPSTLIARTQWSGLRLRKRGTNEWVLGGDIQ